MDESRFVESMMDGLQRKQPAPSALYLYWSNVEGTEVKGLDTVGLL